ncbi:TfoX/Sxy family protein [Desulforamulus ruminis]|uniref:TfoX domain-containing protein n=1 Tax=Desulforamulus ruminis (strain ATCC 23193 / DSM 2154 / NCIMB 8452 / DL) TaxID=696281 RepID=F6DS34_DESRL|nr:TfoX/Sxy family protein [Desulforamulus ruminis]AEG58796.1 TfoX domain-containing protein [Desulforamulus ruminis DSM 2154]
MSGLKKLPNIGEILEEKLKKAGIHCPEDLINLGSREAFRRLRNYDGDGCYNMLCALEGAIQGVRWHYLSEKDKRSLKEFYMSLK